MTRSTLSRRARNSASVMTVRRRPASRPSRRRCFLASRRVEPSTPVTSSRRLSRTLTTVFGGSSGELPSSEPPEPRRRRRRRRRLPRTRPRPPRRPPRSASPASAASSASSSSSSSVVGRLGVRVAAATAATATATAATAPAGAGRGLVGVALGVLRLVGVGALVDDVVAHGLLDVGGGRLGVLLVLVGGDPRRAGGPGRRAARAADRLGGLEQGHDPGGGRLPRRAPRRPPRRRPRPARRRSGRPGRTPSAGARLGLGDRGRRTAATAGARCRLGVRGLGRSGLTCGFGLLRRRDGGQRVGELGGRGRLGISGDSACSLRGAGRGDVARLRARVAFLAGGAAVASSPVAGSAAAPSWRLAGGRGGRTRPPRGAASRGGGLRGGRLLQPERPRPVARPRPRCLTWFPVGSFSSVTGILPSAPGAGHTTSGAARGGRVMPSPGATESQSVRLDRRRPGPTRSRRQPPTTSRSAARGSATEPSASSSGPCASLVTTGGDGGARSATARRAARTSSGRTAGVACRTTT